MAENDETTDPQPDPDEARKQKRNQLLSQVNRLESMNRDTMQQLQQRSKAPPGIAMLQMRLEVLISALLGNQDSLQRLQFELVWQRELNELLSTAYNAASQKKIHVPGQN